MIQPPGSQPPIRGTPPGRSCRGRKTFSYLGPKGPFSQAVQDGRKALSILYEEGQEETQGVQVKPLNSVSLEPCFVQPIREVLSKGSDGLHELQPSNHEVQPIGRSAVLEPNCACEVPMRADSMAIFMVGAIILGFP